MPSNKKAISRIWVEGYKSLHDEQSVEIRPITILAGANSSGKSSIMQPLLLLKQTLDATADPGAALLIDGPNISFTSGEQMLSRIPGTAPSSSFSVGIQIEDRKLYLKFCKQARKGFDIEIMKYEEGEKKHTIKYDMTESAILSALPKAYSAFTGRQGVGWKVTRERCFLSFALPQGRNQEFLLGGFNVSPGHSFVKPIVDIIHLPALRGNPERTYKKVSKGPNFPGTFQDYAASMVDFWQAEQNNRLRKLGQELERMGLTWKVAARSFDETHIELRVGRLVHPVRGSAYDLVSIADVGFGVSQSLPIIVALLTAQPGQLVYLEQPELHLHPRAQRSLAWILNRASKRGAILVVETHSDLLIREFQTLVAKGKLDKNKIILHWFARDKEKGFTVVNSAEMDKNGAYGSWPEDFDVTKLDAEKDYLDAVEARAKA